MSIRLMTAVWDLVLAHDEQLVLLALADHAHDDGSKCFPGVRYLAWKTNYSERQVQRALRSMEAAGLIVAVAFANGGRGHATEYRINIEKGVKKTPYRAAERVTSTTGKGDILSSKGDIYDRKGDPDVTPTVKNHHLTTIEPVAAAALPRRALKAHRADPAAILWRECFGVHPTPAQLTRIHQYEDSAAAKGLPDLIAEAIRATALAGGSFRYFQAKAEAWIANGGPDQRTRSATVRAGGMNASAGVRLPVVPDDEMRAMAERYARQNGYADAAAG
jgi:hypothetical protein